jgi:CRISPR/Cas system CMR-associated protein Cmr5 small subunit
MKKNIIVLIILLIPTILISQSLSKCDIKKTAKEFEKTILKNDLKATLNFFDPEYRQTQHDNFLSGNTNQFITEFLAGAPKGAAIYRTPKIEEIKSIKLKNIKISDDNTAESILQVKLTDGTILKSNILIVLDSQNRICFVGAVG